MVYQDDPAGSGGGTSWPRSWRRSGSGSSCEGSRSSSPPSTFRQVGETVSSGIVALGPVSVGRERVVAAAGALRTGLLLFAILDRTTLGTALRATAEDKVAAGLMGIDSTRMFALAWALGAGCVGAAGALLAIYFPIFPDVGATFGLLAFVTVALGGFGSVSGAVLAGVLIGVVVNVGGPARRSLVQVRDRLRPLSRRPVRPATGAPRSCLTASRPAPRSSGAASRSGAVALVLVATPFAFGSSTAVNIGVLVLLFAMLGTAWNLLGGYAGQISFGHAVFFGTGPYSSTCC